jgi:hypothetical protein
MATDIHMYVEYRYKLAPTSSTPNPWKSLFPMINPGRNYALFGILANVRTKMGIPFPPKGFPQDAGYYAMDDNYLYVSDTDTDSRSVTHENAERFVTEFGSHIMTEEANGHQWVSHPDWHSHSWLTTEEFKQAMEMYNRQHKDYPEVEYDALLAAMKYLDKHKCEARVVFWFSDEDNGTIPHKIE